MGMYDLYRQIAIDGLMAQGEQEAQQYAAEYQGALADLSQEWQAMTLYSPSRALREQYQAAFEARREQFYALYTAKLAQLQADIDTQTAQIHQEYDAKDAEYASAFAALGDDEPADETPEQPIWSRLAAWFT